MGILIINVMIIALCFFTTYVMRGLSPINFLFRNVELLIFEKCDKMYEMSIKC